MFRKALGVVVFGLLVLAATPALAHQRVSLNGIAAEVGWIQEPAIAGILNGVAINATKDGKPVEGLRLSVVVTFGDRTSPKADLEPSDETPGTYSAPIIPTSVGTYAFHITGSANGEPVDKIFTSGERTFEDVSSPSDLEFPAKNPTAQDLALHAIALDGRIAKVDSRAAGAARDGCWLGSARWRWSSRWPRRRARTRCCPPRSPPPARRWPHPPRRSCCT